MDATLGQSGRIGGRIGGREGSDEEIFDRVWKKMGFIENMPLSEMYGLLKNIEDESNEKRRKANDPGVVVMAQMVINRVQDMFGQKAERISFLKEDSAMILEWIVSEGGGDDAGYIETEFVSHGPVSRRFSVSDSDDMSDDETASLMEVDRIECKRSMSVPSSICDSHIDMACSLKVTEFNLCKILEDLEVYHHNIEMNFASLESRLDGIKNQNAYHLQYLKDVGRINDGLFEKVRFMRHEVSEVQRELSKLTEVANGSTGDKEPTVTRIDLVGTTLSPGDTQIYHQLTKPGTKPSIHVPNDATQGQTTNVTTHTTTTTILIAFISIIIFIMSFFTSK
ncbi:uncharacterized protein AC631_03946 [Debaryomyces fabryi]|uniref:Uncharacterized protein n=1 Tax=Debaryomyces fabryi TaxID=58627 RepID=A0A0V1PW51_9ASCO|nr:uncharacterized protein AC631_03946 [Debaryomyces fabryi]KSA00284.1 hypothetical protein AC631_03946 [Debaryomyces fabryi]CUM49705.1 unnamed protein product [Debaryomyces fabryi]